MNDLAVEIDAIADKTQRDLLSFVAHNPPDHTMMRNLCDLAATLYVAELATKIRGCRISQAVGFIQAAAELSLGVEQVGAPNSVLSVLSRSADDFSILMLDMIAGRE
jgi:hypothetical protein